MCRHHMRSSELLKVVREQNNMLDIVNYTTYSEFAYLYLSDFTLH